jgi:hypothetical protein
MRNIEEALMKKVLTTMLLAITLALGMTGCDDVVSGAKKAPEVGSVVYAGKTADGKPMELTITNAAPLNVSANVAGQPVFAYTPSTGDTYVIKVSGLVVSKGTVKVTADAALEFSSEGFTFTATVSAGGLKFSGKITASLDGDSIPELTLTVEGNKEPDVTAPADAFTSLAEALAYLSSHTDGSSVDKPVPLKLSINLSSATDGWVALVNALGSRKKYVALDLSACSISGTEFDLYHDTDPDPNDGRKYIVSLILPDSAISVVNSGVKVVIDVWSNATVSNSGYSKLKTISGVNIGTIGNLTFNGCTALTTVSFPEATSIEYYAFYNCTSLTTVSFPEATSIESSAFGGCTALTTVSFPEVTSIGNYAFSCCTSLTTVSFPKATSIGDGAFGGCTALTTVSFPEVTSIGEYAFSSCMSLTEVSAPKATSVSFDGCTALTSVSFPEATSVSFSDCTSLTEVSAPKATSVSFNNCKSLPLSMVNFSEATELSLSGFTTLTDVSAPKATSVGFDGCTSLTSVSFPEATSVSFSGCTALTSVSVPKVTRIEFYAFANSGTMPLFITMGAAAPTVSGGTFNGVTATKNVTVRVPTGATGYSSTWQTAFKEWNSNINLVVEDERGVAVEEESAGEEESAVEEESEVEEYPTDFDPGF